MIAYALFAAILLVPGDGIIGSPFYLVGAGGMFLSMLWIMKVWTGKRMLFAVLLLAALVRITAIYQFPENSDINRYIWEGEVQRAGYNPYILPPNAEVLKHLRNENWNDVNFKTIPAIYWPFAQMLFRAGAAISPTHNFFKTILVAFDLGTLILLLLILRSVTRDFREIVLYALNPLTVISIAGEGHLESILVFWIILSLYGCRSKKYWVMYLSLGLAVMTKLTPVIFLPLLVQRNNIRYFLFFFLPFGLMLPYMDPGMDFFASLDTFLEFKHNGLEFYIINTMINIQSTAWVSALIAACICGFIFFLTPDRTRSVFLLSAILLVFAPTFHTWYLLLITPFVVLYRSPPWILLHFTMLPLVFFFHPWATHPLWHNWPVLQAFEFLPFIAASLWCFWKNISYWPVWFPQAGSVSVVIVVDDPEQDVTGCIQSIGRPECPIEVIVVHSDPSGIAPNFTHNFPDVKMVSSEPGRWLQISSGVNAANNNLVVLHSADHRLLPGMVSRMLDALRKNENAVGGYLGFRNHPSIQNRVANRLLSVLDRLWVNASGIPFGDDAVFFRRDAFPMYFSTHEQVADIELSLRMKEAGAIVFIPDGTTRVLRKHKPAGSGMRSIQTVYKTLWYLTLRRFGMVSGARTDGHLAVPAEPAKKQAV